MIYISMSLPLQVQNAWPTDFEIVKAFDNNKNAEFY